MRWLKLWLAFSLLVAPVSPALAQSETQTSLPNRSALTVRGSFYVPAYTGVPPATGRHPFNFTVSLTIHNTSSAKPLVVERIAYYAANGELVQDYISAPAAIPPFGTLDVGVDSELEDRASNPAGSTGANFVVDWAAAGPIAEPIMETLILGNFGTHGFSFVGEGRPIRIVGEEP